MAARVCRYSEKQYEEYLAKQATKLQALWRGHFDRHTILPQKVAMKVMEQTRLRTAAIKLQRAYRKRTERITALATRIQTFYRGYRARMNTRLQRKFKRINDGRKRRIARLNRLTKFLGKKSHHDRIAKFEVSLLAAWRLRCSLVYTQ